MPRSPIAELIERGFEPWLGEREVRRALDLCTGSGCIAIAMAHYNPDWQVDGVDISDDALALAQENKARLHADNVRLLKSDLFSGAAGRALRPDRHQSAVRHQRRDRRAAAEYSHEPELGLRAGDDGLDLALKILRDAPLHLTDDGLLICEVGEAEQRAGDAAAGTAVRVGRVQGRADGHLRRSSATTWSRTTRASSALADAR